MRLVISAALALGLGGCATLSRGTMDEVAIVSDPTGAEASTSFGSRCTTPCSFLVKRDQEFTVTLAKSGYVTQSVAVTTRLSGSGAALASENIATAGLGLTVDAVTGAALEHVPGAVAVTLTRTAATRVKKLRHIS